MFPIYKYKQSSAFASKVDRQGRRMRNSYNGFGTNLGGNSTFSKPSTNQLMTNPMSPTEGNRENEEEDDEYYEEDDDGTTPGPGAYFNP